MGLRKRGNGPFSIRHGATVLFFLNLYPFFAFLSYCTVALTPPPPSHPPTSIQCHCDALLAYKLTKQPTEGRDHISLKTNFKNRPICIQLSWIHEHKVREVVDRGDVAEWGCTFSSGSSIQNEGKKTLLSGLSALIKLILALCMVLYLFISPSFLPPKLKSPNKDPPTPP